MAKKQLASSSKQYIMKRLIVILSITFGLVSGICIAQSENENFPVFDIIFKGGIAFPKNENIQKMYNAKSAFQFTSELRFGKSDWDIFPWVSYSFYQLSIDSSRINKTSDCKLSKKMIGAGIVNSIPISKRDYIQLKGGLTVNFISDSITGINSKPIGYVLSVGYSRLLSTKVRTYLEIGYDYARIDNSRLYREWGGYFINLGISFNLARIE